jgi:hypothetical protein
MGRLTVISVTGTTFHSACRLEYHGPNYNDGWLGFGPAKHHHPASRIGKVFREDENFRINHGIMIEVEDTILFRAGEEAVKKYSSGMYLVGVRDCVSFSADLVRECRLNVPSVSMTPYGFIFILAAWNPYEKLW